MTARLATAPPVGGFDLTALLGDDLRDLDPPVRDLVAVYAVSFVAAAGRQHIQVHDLYTLAALLADPRDGVYRRPRDWARVQHRDLAQRIAGWPLPGGHTLAPERTPGQVAGIYRFWWTVAVDAINARVRGGTVPRAENLAGRLHHGGVPLYVTTSSTWEEVVAVYDAHDTVRRLGGQACAQDLVRASLPARLSAELHWQTWRRHARRTHATHDPHASVMRTFIPAARAADPAARTAYDRLWLLVARELDRARGQVAQLHERAVAAYNRNHPDTPIAALHH